MRKQQQDLGPLLVSERASGVPWKELQKRFRLSRGRLYQLWRSAGGAPGMACPNCGFHVARTEAERTGRGLPRP